MTHRRIWVSCAFGTGASAPIAISFGFAWHWHVLVAVLYAWLLSFGLTLIALNWRRK